MNHGLNAGTSPTWDAPGKKERQVGKTNTLQDIFDESEDAAVADGNNPWMHGLTSKSIEYDKAKLRCLPKLQ